MIDARQTAPRFLFTALTLAGTYVSTAFAQSDATSGDQWRPSGVTRPAFVQVAPPASNNSSASPTWRLPNGQQPSDADQSTSDNGNPLRKKETPAAKSNEGPPEPATFQAPANAKKLSANQSAATTNNPANRPAQRPNQSAAVAKAPANVTNKQVNVQQRPQPANRTFGAQPPAYQRPQQANMAYRAPDGSPSMWQTINVAFQGEPVQKRSLENLPPPGEKSVTLPDPVMKHFDGPGAFIGPYQPYGESGQCCDGSCNGSCPCDGCCDPACGSCGCPCNDPGCGCEPGCGEPSCGCDNGGEKDLFSIGPGDDESCHTIRVRWPKWQEVTAFGGVQGFKGPYDQNRDSGNFGFNEGFNIGAKVPYAALGYQFGYRATQDELNGDESTGDTKGFLQQFATAGLFHRQCEGLNFGVAWDILSDERVVTEHYNQIRSELSIRDGGCHEIGATISVGLNDHGFDDGDGGQNVFEASDQYLLFYRFHGCEGGEGRFFAGCNNNKDGLLGADMLIPVGERFSVQAGFEYLIPDGKNGVEGASQEAWNIGLGLVWHWDCQAHKCFDNCYRPMFNVADNGTLIVDKIRHTAAPVTASPAVSTPVMFNGLYAN